MEKDESKLHGYIIFPNNYDNEKKAFMEQKLTELLDKLDYYLASDDKTKELLIKEEEALIRSRKKEIE